MPRPCRFAAYAIIFSSIIASAQSENNQQTHLPHPAKWSPKAQEMFVSYWTLEPGWSTELEVRNNIAHRDLTVTPVLRTMAGTEIILTPVTVPPEHVAAIDLRQAISSTAPELLDRADSYGSVVCRYSSNSGSNVFAATMVQRNGTPIAFHFDEEPIDAEWNAGSMESIWWLPRSTSSDYLILSNASNRPVTASLDVTDAAGRNSRQGIGLGPAQTMRIDMRAIAQAAHLTDPKVE